jgi:mycothiol synthase
MTSGSTFPRVERSEFDWSADEGPAAGVRRVLAEATAEDGAEPLDEAALLALRHRALEGTSMWAAGPAGDLGGFAWLHDGALDLVVRPSARRAGLGRGLAAAAVSSTDEPLTAWSHGNHPAAAALAERFGFERVRDLWVMRRPLTGLPPLPRDAEEVDVRPFRVGVDEDAWLAVNAEAFVHHPEQGATTRADLEQRIGEPWFDPNGFFLAWRADELVGFHWTKVHEGPAPYGEVYVVGVSPRAQGGGLGRLLTLVGLHHLAERGLSEVLLYVESDNAPAIAVYQRLGFTHAPEDTHVQYSRP